LRTQFLGSTGFKLLRRRRWALLSSAFLRVFPRFLSNPVKPGTGGRDHVDKHVTKHEPRLASIAEEVALQFDRWLLLLL